MYSPDKAFMNLSRCHPDVSDHKLHTVSFEVFRSLSAYEFATFYFNEKTCEIAMLTYSRIFS